MKLFEWLRSPPWAQATYWALDIETSGLDAKRDAILSVGMVPIREGVIRVGDAFETLVQTESPVPDDSLKIHHILPQELATAPRLNAVLPQILSRLQHGLLLVHYAAIDVAFLKQACRQRRLPWYPVRVVDTLKLLLRLQHNQRFYTTATNNIPTNLMAARRHLGLPDYPEHDALSDAIATAELFLALAHRLGVRTVRDVW
jgi:DNA polymerase-3 subunit epsilon